MEALKSAHQNKQKKEKRGHRKEEQKRKNIKETRRRSASPSTCSKKEQSTAPVPQISLIGAPKDRHLFFFCALLWNAALEDGAFCPLLLLSEVSSLMMHASDPRLAATLCFPFIIIPASSPHPPLFLFLCIVRQTFCTTAKIPKHHKNTAADLLYSSYLFNTLSSINRSS